MMGSLAILFAAGLHVLQMDCAVTEPDEGFVLGNGDLSVSAYQTMDAIVFRFGKGDVWDRRIETEKDPPPCTVRDYIDIALGRKDPGGFTNRSNGVSKAYPMPKPVGELKLHVPANLPGHPTWRQRLVVEEGRVEISAEWENGVKVDVEAVVDPDRNDFACRWRCSGWGDDTRLGRGEPPVFFTLEREADPTPREFLSDVVSVGFSTPTGSYPDCEPLPPPVAVSDVSNGLHYIEQRFYPDNLFPEGFRYRMHLVVGKDCGRVNAVKAGPKRAMIRFFGWSRDVSGQAVVRVETSRDVQRGGAWTERYARPEPFAKYASRVKESVAGYWRKSSFSVPGDPALERLWYSIYHARRCLLKGGTVPPGLFFPSSLRHYSIWHGDYHSNYNLESIYWGDFTANHPEQAEAYFDCVDFYRPVGRIIAEKYYGCRGVFIQLEGFPVLAKDDYNGRLTLGRMAYMTGWAMSRYWEYYRFTLDREWLRTRGYPFIKECALFYLDFLKKAPHPDLPPNLKDGKYHIFPSIAGESSLKPGQPMTLCDQWSPIAFSRHCLWAAAEAAKELGVDSDLAAQWRERCDNLAGVANGLKGYPRHCLFSSPPEYAGKPYVPPPKWDGKPEGFSEADRWYFGLRIRDWMGRLRQNRFIPARDFPHYRKLLATWSRPNGLVRAMSLPHYGRTGGWTETLSCMAPVQEMILQSWDGAIRLFPYWPKDRDVSFRDWRTTGAFLVSAGMEGGRISPVKIVSLKGADCLVHGEWTVTDVASGAPVATDRDAFGRLRFRTAPNREYRLEAR